MRRQLPLFLFVVIWACGCRTSPDTNTQAVKDSVLRYNQLLAEAYAKMNMNPLREAATADQAAKEYRHMAALGEAKIRMESALKNIEFSGVTFLSHDEASVITKEIWDYTHIDMRTRAPVKVQKNVPYTLKYELKQKNARWYVASIQSIEEEQGAAPARGVNRQPQRALP